MRYLKSGDEVHVADNLSRNGSRANLAMLQQMTDSTSGNFHFHHLDIRMRCDVGEMMARIRPDLIVHQAGQVAVTTSVVNPRLDFEVNAMGTLNLLEAFRESAPEAFFIYASTNKVYGSMHDVEVIEETKRYRYRDFPDGLCELRKLDFHSPYACSKGAADQYVHDYSRIYGLRTAVFRQSCIYGTHQYGVEDQGWIAWFTIARVLGKPVTIYGSGKQVRDVLWIEDLVEAYHLAWQLDKSGSIYNMGGGVQNSISLIELTELLDELHPVSPPNRAGEMRPGDQSVYIANANLAKSELKWTPKVSPRQGIERLYAWVCENQRMIETVLNTK